jgi:purine catabolism regulator
VGIFTLNDVPIGAWSAYPAGQARGVKAGRIVVTTMNLQEALRLPALSRARVVAAASKLGNRVLGAHAVDIPDPQEWIRPGFLFLTTGYAWPREAQALRAFMRQIARAEPAAVVLAVPQFFERFPEAARQEAERAGIPAIELPWEVPFSQVIGELNQQLLAQQYSVIERSEAIHRALTRSALEAGGLQPLADVLSQLTGRSVVFEDLEGNLLAYALTGGEDELRLRSIASGGTTPELSHYLQEIGFERQLRQSLGPLRLPARPEIGMVGRVVCPIRLGGELVGSVWLIEGEEPLSELDMRAAEHAATVAGLHLMHQRDIAQREARLGYAFLDALLEGRFEPTPHNLERARLQGFHPEGCYYLALLVLEEPVPLSPEGFNRRERLAEDLRKLLREQGLTPLISVFLNQILFLLPEGFDANRLWERLPQKGLSLGLSRARQGWAGVAESYRESQALLPHLRPGELSTYAQLLLPRVLAGDAQAQQDLLRELFGPLEAERGREALLETLKALAQHGFQLKRTAHALGVHENTLRYRLERLQQLTGLDLREPQAQFRLQLGLQILELNHSK